MNREPSRIPCFRRGSALSRLALRWLAPLGGVLAAAVAPVALGVDLQVTNFSDIDHDPSPVGTTVVYQVVVANGASTVANDSVTVFDLPAGAELAPTAPAFCSAAPGSGGSTRVTCINPVSMVTSDTPHAFALPVLTRGRPVGSMTLHAAIGYAASAPDASLPLSGLSAGHAFFGGDTNQSNNVLPQQTTLTEATDLQLTKTATPDPVIGGGQISYTLTVKNLGPSAATGFTVTDTLDSNTGLSNGSASGAGWSFAGANGTFNGSLAVGSEASYTYKAKVNVGSGTVTNGAVVRTGAGQYPDTHPGNNTDEVTTRVTPGADLTLTKTAAPVPATAGEMVTFTLNARNLGPSTASNVRVLDTLPAGLSFVSASSTAGSCTGSTTVACTLGDMGKDASQTITIVARVALDASGTVTNTASIASDTPDPFDQGDDNLASATFNVLVDGADVGITKSKTKARVPVWKPGQPLADSVWTSRIAVTNAGPRAVSGNLQVVDTLAEGEKWVDAAGSDLLPGAMVPVGNWQCSVDAVYAAGRRQVVTCDMLSGYPLALDGTAELSLHTLPLVVGELRNQVCTAGGGSSIAPLTVGGVNRDPNLTNNCTGAGAIATDGFADLKISKRTNAAGEGDNIVAITDDHVDFTISVSSSADSAATGGVVINDTMPGHAGGALTVLNQSHAGWNCTTTGGSLRCESGTTLLLPGPDNAFTVTMRAARPLADSLAATASACTNNTAGRFCNTAGASIDLRVPNAVGIVNAGDDTASDWFAVYPVTNVATTGKAITSGNPGRAGVETTYVVAYKNQNKSTATGVVMRDVFTLPADDAGFVLISAQSSKPGSTCAVTASDAGIISRAASGGTSYANTASVPQTLTVSCTPIALAGDEARNLTVKIRPNVDALNTGRAFSNVADFFLDRDGGGVADPASGVDANGIPFNHNSNPDDDSQTATLNFEAGAVDLLTQKEDLGFIGGIDPLGFDSRPGQNANNILTYRISVRNQGPSLATGTHIVDTITAPAGAQIRLLGSRQTAGGAMVALDAADSLCQIQDGTNPTALGAQQKVRCDMPSAGSGMLGTGQIGVNQTSYLYLVYEFLTAPPAYGATILNTVIADSNEDEQNENNNKAEQTTSIRTRSDLQVRKSMTTTQPDSDPSVVVVPDTEAFLFQPLWYVLDVTNLGPGHSRSVDRNGSSPLNGTGTVLTDVLAPGLELIAGAQVTWRKIDAPTPTGDSDLTAAGTGTCSQVGRTLTCQLGDLALDGKARVLIPSRWVSLPAGGQGSNSVSLKTEQVDPDPSSDNSTVTNDIKVSSLAGRVFEDSDRAGSNGGVFQGAETGLSGVTVTLSGKDQWGNPLSKTVTTDSSGNYRFIDLPPSDADGYTLAQTQPASHNNGPVQPPTTGTNAPSEGGIYAGGGSQGNSSYSGIVLAGDTDGVRYDFPEVRRPSLSGVVYVDADFSNAYNSGSDTPIANTMIELINAVDGSVLGRAVTNNVGVYSFNNLDPEITYTLREVLPNGGYRNRPSAINPGTINGQSCVAGGCVAETGVGGDAASTDRISNIDLSAGFDGINFNFGEDAITSISGIVYLDRDDNGSHDSAAGDASISGVVIILQDDSGTEIARTTTDVDGNYNFVDLVVGKNYTVVEEQPSGYGNGKQSPGNEITINNLPLAGSRGNNFGEKLGSLSGFVFEDFSATAGNSNNGSYEPAGGERPIASVTLTLTGTDIHGNPVNLTTTTAADGSYRFDDLMPADAAGYVLTQTQPAGYLDGKHTAGNGVVAGSNAVANVISGINLSAGQQASGYLFGELANASISGTVYLDRNDDGDQQVGSEPGIPGVTITIEGAGADGVFGTADDTSVTVTTDADGNYSYGGSVAGQDYRITETQPSGLADGQENTSNTITISNLPGTGSADNNFGELAASLAGMVYLDSNNNGVRDAGEPALVGVQVSLPAGTKDALGNVVTSATTAADGSYRFDDLLAGTYSVTEPAAQPVYNGTTTLNGVTTAGTIDGVSSGTATAVATVPSNIAGIVLPAGKHSVSNDFAEILPVAASGTVFFDVNNDGAMAGVAETGIGGVEITLTGTDDLGNAVSLSTTTVADGTFSFEGLRPGTYTLTEPIQPAGTANGITTAGNVGGSSSGTATPVTTTPSAIASIDLTTPGSSSVDNLFGELPTNSGITGRVWEDRDNDGVVDPGEPGLPGVEVVLIGTDIQGNPITPITVVTDANGEYSFTNLPPGTYSVTETRQPPGTADGQTVPGTTGGSGSTPGSATDGNPSTITTITVGVGEISEENNFGEIPVGSISGKVYNDGNDNGIADNDEGGYAGIVIGLVGSDDLGNPVNLSTTTDADGNYRFDDLRPGTYTVTETTQPAETLNGITTAGNIGGNSVGVATGKDTVPSSISQIVLPIGGDSLHNNFGEIGDSSDIQVSKSLDSAKLTVNNRSTYTITVRNAGQKPSQGEYMVEDRLPVGITLADVPSGDGWTCSGAVGDSRFSCRSSTPVAPGERSGSVISVAVNVAEAAAEAGVVSNAVIVSGGGDSPFRTPSMVERDSFEGDVTQLPECVDGINHNACRLPIPAQLSASVGGTVWFDGGSEDAQLDGSDKRLPDWIVELVDPSTDTVARTTTTAADGSYNFTDVIPGKEWNIRFRDPVSGIIWAWPVNEEHSGSNSVSCDTATALANGTSSACRGSADGVSQLLVVLAPGEHLPQQSLPVDPAGVVYDAVSRDPVPGSIVTMTPVGVCPAYDPALAVLNATAGGYRIEGSAISMTVGNDGFYQFIFGPGAPASCEYRLDVTPPSGYQFVSDLIAPENGALSPPGRIGENWLVQPQPTPPTVAVGEGTRYWLNVISGSGTAGIIHNHIPLDAAVAPGLVITKTGDRQIVELGDTLQYTISVRQTAGSSLSMVNIVDTLPRGFTYIDGTARLGGSALADPAGAPGPRLGFALGAINVGEQLSLTYRVRVGVGALQGDGINRAQAHGCSINGGCINTDAMSPLPGSIPSNQAQYRVRVTGGVFSTEACVLGKVFVDCNLNHVQDEEELGIPGVRLYFSDGTWLVSDVEGKYSYCGLPANSHTLKVDASTLPHGSRLTTSSNRNLGDADSLFLDLKNGELHRADFIEGSCANPVLEQVKARRSQGEVRAPETEAGQPSLRFDSKPLRAPQQATDSANQRPIVQPRNLESVDASQEVQP